MARAKAKILDLFRAFADFRRAMVERLFDPYRPELHYMRGPGPRCQAKKNPSQV
jgi:hypothetical protein